MTEQNPAQKHVVIIGGGAIGFTTAYYLVASGHRVTIIEKDQFEDGASIGNAGMLVPSHVVPLAAPGVITQGMRWLFKRTSPFRIKPRLDPALLRWLWQFRSFCTEAHVDASMPLLRDLSLASVDLFAELANQFDFDFERRGLLMLHTSQKGEQENLKYAKQAKRVGLEVETLDKNQLSTFAPDAGTSAIGAVYYPQDAHMSPHRFISALHSNLSSLGVKCLSGVAVTGFQQHQQQVNAVHSSAGTIAADEIILATGSWTPRLGQMLGLTLPIQPAKGYSVTLPAPTRLPKVPMILTEAKVTITPMGDQLRFGGTLELAGFDPSVDRVRASSILATIQTYFPALDVDSIKTEQIWSGYRPCTPDGLPLIGRPRSLKNVIVAAGHAMIGITLAPITGKLVAQLVEKSVPSLNITALDPDRFSKRYPPSFPVSNPQHAVVDAG